MKKGLIVVCAVSLLAVGCIKKASPVAFQGVSDRAVVGVTISADYSAGNIGLYSITDSVAYKNLLSNWIDNDIRTYNGAIYVLERYGKDNILKINGSVINGTAIAYEKNIGTSVNIQDIAFINDTKAYITELGSSKLAIFDPSTGTTSAKTIDLSPYNTHSGIPNADDFPYAAKALYYNDRVYVACQRLTATAGGLLLTTDTSKILVINSTKDTIEKAINLFDKNPQELSICNGKLYVGSSGTWAVNDAGGIEVIDLATNTNTGTIIDESAFSGDIASIIVVSDTKGYAVVSTPSFSTELHSFNPQAKTVGPKISGLDAPCSGHMAFDGTYVYVGDRSDKTPGIVIIDPSTDAKVGSTKDIGLPPNSLALLETSK